jgi:sigma-B regulation protein RsbU (phosphoserine phosphatase)
MPLLLLVVSSDQSFVALASSALLAQGHDVLIAAPGEAAARLEEKSGIEGAIIDLRTAREQLERIAALVPQAIAAGESGAPEEIIAALRAGARDYLPPPINAADLLAALGRRGPSPPEPIHASLEYREETGDLRFLPLGKEHEVRLGRDPANDLCFGSQVVSRFHARIRSTPEGHEVVEEQSRHGLFVNDERVTRRLLADGDRIQLGRAGAPTLLYRAHATAEDAPLKADTRLYDSLGHSSNRELKDIARLLDTFLKLNTDLVLDEVLELVLSCSLDFAGAERGMILLLEGVTEWEESQASERTALAAGDPGSVLLALADGRKLRLAMARHRDGTPVSQAGLTISHKIPEQVIASGTGIIAEDLLEDEQAELHVATIEIGVRSAMCVPLRARRPGLDPGEKATTLGVLYVDSRLRSRAFSPQLLHALESLAGEAAQAIINARLYQMSLEKRRIDEEMRIARSIQENLQPPESYENAWIELYGSSRPSSEVGGDLMDYYPVGESRLGLLVGDVSGKGIPAAIFSAMLDGHFYGLSSLRHPREDLGSLLVELNRYLVKKSRLQKFVSIVFGIIEAEGELVYVNAGHNPPIHVTAGGEVCRLASGGMILGMFEEAAYDCGFTRLDAGDVLLLYSDGITEARNSAREQFSMARLEALAAAHRHLGARAIHRTVLGELNRFVAGAPLSDDVTLLVVKKR